MFDPRSVEPHEFTCIGGGAHRGGQHVSHPHKPGNALRHVGVEIDVDSPVAVYVGYTAPPVYDLGAVTLVVAQQHGDARALQRGIRNRLRIDGEMVVVALEHRRGSSRDRAVVGNRSGTSQSKHEPLGWRIRGHRGASVATIRECPKPTFPVEMRQEERLLAAKPKVTILLGFAPRGNKPGTGVRPGRCLCDGVPDRDGIHRHVTPYPHLHGADRLPRCALADQGHPVVVARGRGAHRKTAPSGRDAGREVHLAEFEIERRTTHRHLERGSRLVSRSVPHLHDKAGLPRGARHSPDHPSSARVNPWGSWPSTRLQVYGRRPRVASSVSAYSKVSCAAVS